MKLDEIAAVVFIDIAIIIVVARFMGALFKRFRQPPVVGEIVGGIILGPSLLGLFPGHLPLRVFPLEVRPFLTILAQVGNGRTSSGNTRNGRWPGKDRKSTRLNSSHRCMSYAVMCLKKIQISISSLQTHNVNRCGRSRHLARKLSLRRKRSSPNVFEMAATETITSIILIKLIRVSLGTVRHPRRFKIVVIDIQITLKQMLRDFIGIRVNRAKKSGMVNITSSVNSRERSGINTILHELNPLFTINVTMRDIKSKNVYSRVNSKATTQWRKTESANGVHLEGVASDNRSS